MAIAPHFYTASRSACLKVQETKGGSCILSKH